MKTKLLCLCDSPTLQTGFARVAQNLLKHWLKRKANVGHGILRDDPRDHGRFDEIHVWGIGYEGWPHDLPFTIFPAQRYAAQNWHQDSNLSRFLSLLSGGGYTHVWIMQDPFQLYPIAADLKRICRDKRIRSALYFPVDAPMDRSWVDICTAVDVPVAYCEYGRFEAMAAFDCNHRGEFDCNHRGDERIMRGIKEKMMVIPHGIDLSVYRPMPEVRSSRGKMFCDANGKPMVTESDFLIINVNMNQRRKGLVQTLEICSRLVEKYAHPVKLYMHMRRENKDEQADLAAAAGQLGVTVLFAPDSIWPRGLDEAGLAKLYNMADLLLTTSLGEGWGLSITEAMACGTPVAGPDHTSISGIMADGRGVLFGTRGLDWVPFDNSRLRPRADVEQAARMIGEAIQNRQLLKNNADRALEWVRTLEWKRIAQQWLNVLIIEEGK